jgi:plasmid stabilization system protein ParE
MVFKIVVEPDASLDIDDACAYYFSLPVDTVRLVDSFLTDIQIAFDTLAINPFYQIRTKNYRAIPLTKFPYLLFFTVDEVSKMVNILALFNTHQNPTKYPE